VITDYKKIKITSLNNTNVSYVVDDYMNLCDSTVAYDLFFSNIKTALVVGTSKNIKTVKKCEKENKIKIIINNSAESTEPAVGGGVSDSLTFSIAGIPVPASNPVNFVMTDKNNYNVFDKTIDYDNSRALPATVIEFDKFMDSSFKIDLSDETPGAKNVVAKYTFSFKSVMTSFVITNTDSVIHFIFSNDFVLPPVENMKVIVNDTVLDAGKNEYVLQYKTTCVTPDESGMLYVNDAEHKFNAENKLCMKIYTLFIKSNITVTAGSFTVALKGITNPAYSPPTVAYDKQDYLFQAFNASYCILNLNVRDAGRYLFNPRAENYSNASIYLRGNYPVKNKKPADGNGGDNAGDEKMKSSDNRSVESRPGSSRAANVYTVNYFYDGQGQGEYGYIARPDIFGTTPYSYGTSRGGLGTSDKHIAKQYRDLEEQKRLNEDKQKQWNASQVRPPMGVAPALLNEGVQPYDSTINF
jgi:hypothetical protein